MWDLEFVSLIGGCCQPVGLVSKGVVVIGQDAASRRWGSRSVMFVMSVVVLGVSALPGQVRAENAPVVVSFSDVPGGHVFEEPVAWLASSGITQGRDDGSFGLDDPVTRGAMAAFLYRYDGEPSGPFEDAPGFFDVPGGHVFEEPVAWLASSGITQGRDDGSFGLVDPVTRGAMAAFLFRYAGEPDFGFEPAPQPDVSSLALGWPMNAAGDAPAPFPVPVPSFNLGRSAYETPYPLTPQTSTVFATKIWIPTDLTVDQVADWWLGQSQELERDAVTICDVVEPDCGAGWESHLLPTDTRELHFAVFYGGSVGEEPVSALVTWLEPDPDHGVLLSIWGYAG